MTFPSLRFFPSRRKLGFFFLSVLVWTVQAAPFSEAARAGIKLNRAKHEYPDAVLRDMERFADDRIREVMIALPWESWEPREGEIDEAFIRSGLTPVLRFCRKKKIRAVLASHNSFWGSQGDWSMPAWIRKRADYRSSLSALTDPAIRELHKDYLKRWIKATRRLPAVWAYNILNEPAAATRWYAESAAGRAEFEARWEGVLDIARELHGFMGLENARQELLIGNGNADPGLEALVWETAGSLNLSPLWEAWTGRVGAQGVSGLGAARRFYPGKPLIRTEGVLTYAVLAAWKKAGSISAVRMKWNEKNDASPVLFDYDAAYDYEGLSSADLSALESFYVWRVGTTAGSAGRVTLLDHRHGDIQTPYYAALRDLASGVDSFECLGGSLPSGGKEALGFRAEKAGPAVSRRWSGTGKIEGWKKSLPPKKKADSRMAARAVLRPGEVLRRSVLTAHWRDNGVSAADVFTFWSSAPEGCMLNLVIETRGGKRAVPVRLRSGGWRKNTVPLRALGLSELNISEIISVGFENQSAKTAVFLLDEFLIRGPGG
ncbi:MAG: hypothetical protein FGM27_05825 [Candidatus Omnitrophica bacterium]|nr:hypothetical protein [Candidatus Omnitrophota bacterium]